MAQTIPSGFVLADWIQPGIAVAVDEAKAAIKNVRSEVRFPAACGTTVLAATGAVVPAAGRTAAQTVAMTASKPDPAGSGCFSRKEPSELFGEVEFHLSCG